MKNWPEVSLVAIGLSGALICIVAAGTMAFGFGPIDWLYADYGQLIADGLFTVFFLSLAGMLIYFTCFMKDPK